MVYELKVTIEIFNEADGTRVSSRNIGFSPGRDDALELLPLLCEATSEAVTSAVFRDGS